MRTYEAVFVLDESKFDDAGDALAKEVEQNIEQLGGRVRKKTAMGRRPFSRPMKKKNAGIYWDFIFDMESSNVDSLEGIYRLNDAVLRTGIFLYEGPTPENNEKTADERR
ncbi:MAG: 30S ribosomal protein S6 [Candidatus Pacebacteria bacterium]|nr:30S ribosomal protein S6 [Candidatus Paceibacterota bacterium]